MKVAWYSVFLFLFFCLESMVRKQTWMRTTSVTVMVIFSKAPFWKLLDHSYAQTSFSTITRHIDNGTWRTSYNWRLWQHYQIRANSFLSKYHETKITKVPGKFPKTEPVSQKNIPRRKLVLKFNLASIEWFSPQFIYFFYFFIFCWSWSSSSVLTLFYKN